MQDQIQVSVNRRDLPNNSSDFAEIRTKGCIYADKSQLIYRLSREQRPLYLSRPAQWGKSLLISTLAELFSGNLALFDGTAIRQSWQDKAYRVVRLNFEELPVESGMSTDSFKAAFLEFLQARFGKLKALPPDPHDTPSGYLRSVLLRQSYCSVVMLIDNYDAPLKAAAGSEQMVNRVLTYLGSFYTMLGKNPAPLRLLFITGSTALKDSMVLPYALTDLVDISASPKYAALTGFTLDEAAFYFKDYFTGANTLERFAREGHPCRFSPQSETAVYKPMEVFSYLLSR